MAKKIFGKGKEKIKSYMKNAGSEKDSKDSLKKITTIKLTHETKLRLEKLKENNRESYEHLLKKILFILNLCRENPEKAKRRLKAIDIARKREEIL